MFVTHSPLEQFVPPGISHPDCRYWRGVSLSLETPWYICVTASGSKNGPETTLIAWESELLQLLGSLRAEEGLSAVGRLEKSDDNIGRWELKWVDALWETTLEERDLFGRLVLRFEGESLLRDELLHEVHRNDARALIFRAHKSE